MEQVRKKGSQDRTFVISQAKQKLGIFHDQKPVYQGPPSADSKQLSRVYASPIHPQVFYTEVFFVDLKGEHLDIAFVTKLTQRAIRNNGWENHR